MKPITIKICRSNVVSKHLPLLEKQIACKNVTIVMEECLNKCSFCSDYPYVLINNQLFFGDDIQELMQIIEEEIPNNS